MTKDKNELIKFLVEDKELECPKNFLTVHKDSGLEAMFSGRHPIPLKNNRAFIEGRLASAFEHMLEYLKTSEMPRLNEPGDL